VIGLDLGAPLLEVARRGFSSTFSNRMGQLGGWVPASSGRRGAPMLHLADDLAGALAAREAGEFEQVRVGLAVPSWLGWSDRHHIAQLVDSHDICELVMASTPVVAALGTNLTADSPTAPELPRAAEVVVTVDLDVGISAAVVSIDGTCVRELVACSAAPARSARTDTVTVVLGELVSMARAAGVAGANRVVLVATGGITNSLIDESIRALPGAWGECPVQVVGSRAEIARAAVLLADMESFDVVSAAPRSVAVFVDDDAGRKSRPHVLLARNVSTPVRATTSFEIGPDDGADVYLDVYEEQDQGLGLAPVPADRLGHQLLMTAKFASTANRHEPIDVEIGVGNWPTEVEISLVVGGDGMLRLEPGDIDDRITWTCAWAPSRLVTSRYAVDVPPGPSSRPGSGGELFRPARKLEREMAPPLGLAGALGNAERVVSRRLGRMVAIRSAMALLGCGDRDDLDVLHERADQLERVLELGSDDDDARSAVLAALDAARRAVESRLGRVLAGGSAREVAHELGRVVEHLAVVVGAVSPAERNRLVLDGQLLGLEHDRARSLVDELINDAAVDSDGRPDELRDPTAMVVVSADGFRLAPVGVRLDPDQAAIRVLLFDS
jgi:hypothetical protein